MELKLNPPRGSWLILLVNKCVHILKLQAQPRPHIIKFTLYPNCIPLDAFIPMLWFEANSQHRVKRFVLVVLTLRSMKMTLFMPLSYIGTNATKEECLFKNGITHAYI